MSSSSPVPQNNSTSRPAIPPDVLYHGAGERSLEKILHEGLRRMTRHHVHLSGDPDTAGKVGVRHDRPAVLAVSVAGMRAAGYAFYLSENGVLLPSEPSRPRPMATTRRLWKKPWIDGIMVLIATLPIIRPAYLSPIVAP